MSVSKVDWLGFRTKVHPVTVRRTLEQCFGEVGRVDFNSSGRGRLGFEESGAIALQGMVVGQYGTGGASQRGWSSFSLSGQGCEWIRDWGGAVEVLEDVDYETRRVDLAVDTFRGEVTHQAVVEAHGDGKFTTGGRPPKLMRIESWPREDGWTCYVGQRDQGKFFRGYEKGFQQAKAFGAANHGMKVETIEGVPPADWYRCELELKAKDKALPSDLIERRDQYFAGSYPFCRELIDVEPFQLVMSRERRPQLQLAQTLGLIQEQWGRALFTGLVAYQGDIGAVWAKIVGKEHHRGLIEAGVLLVDHVD